MVEFLLEALTGVAVSWNMDEDKDGLLGRGENGINREVFEEFCDRNASVEDDEERDDCFLTCVGEVLWFSKGSRAGG